MDDSGEFTIHLHIFQRFLKFKCYATVQCKAALSGLLKLHADKTKEVE